MYLRYNNQKIQGRTARSPFVGKKLKKQMEVSKKLKDYRNAFGLTQESLSEKSSISIRTIQRIEKGQSTGSPYTLKKLAQALNIEDWKSLLDDNFSREQSRNLDLVKLMNLSSLAVLLIPLSNFIFPLILFFRKKAKPKNQGDKILSFQLLWSLTTIIIMVLFPLVLTWTFDSLRGTRIPLFILVYFLSVAVNIYFIVKTAIKLNQKKQILTFVPKIF